ncbi:MAG: AAA family ATPase [Planctomycetia bacterium]|nr:AAA family ATPase [Planctomycetia bacterium]
MLKTLELHGFKSFADRTRFEFSSGITVIVGPNGSGKSNVVDAIKWVLGEQSIKSLRGKESTDVIFNGASNRRSQNTAEVTLHFGNEGHELPLDSPDVSITRRVYRSGEGEYLINRQPSRLKDIRELFSGSGVGGNSYCIIEQGRVDALLQASSKDRRLIFEEAAGISRFKAKKQEALRRLERVDQNLLRLSDIISEVEGRLRNIKSQADRAVRFREYNSRLQQLRFQVAAVDWRALAGEIESLELQLEEIRQQRDALSANMDTVDTRLQEYEQEISLCDNQIRVCTDSIAEDQHAIGVAESAVEYQLKRSRELEQNISLDRVRTASIRKKISESLQLYHEAQSDLNQAKTQHMQVVTHLKEAQLHLEEMQKSLDKIRTEKEQARQQSVTWMQELAATENQITQLQKQEDVSSKQFQENAARLTSLQEELVQLQKQQEELSLQQKQASALKLRCSEDQEESRQELESYARQLSEARANLTELTRRHAVMVERISVLEELQERHEGLSPGVRYLLTESRRQPEGPFRDVRGLVADLIQVNVDAAPLIEVALGEKAQYIVVAEHSKLLDELKQNPQGFPGRVGFVWMDDFLPRKNEFSVFPRSVEEYIGKAASDTKEAAGKPGQGKYHGEESASFAGMNRLESVRLTTELEKIPGVVGRADQFIQTAEENLLLMRYMLGETWIVKNLAVAVELSQKIVSGALQLSTFSAAEQGFYQDAPVKIAAMKKDVPPRIHFVTLSGERLDASGFLSVGPHHAASGLISRRSELRTLGEQLSLQQVEIKNAEVEVQQLRQKTQIQKTKMEELTSEFHHADARLREYEHQMSVTAERLGQMRERCDEMVSQQEEYRQEITQIRHSLEESQEHKKVLSERLLQSEKHLVELDQQILREEEICREKSDLVTENQVTLAKSEERLRGLETRVNLCEVNIQERRKSIEDGVQQLEKNCALLVESQRVTLQNESRLALLYLEKERAARELSQARQKRETARRERTELNSSAGRLRKKIRGYEDKVHQLEMVIGTKQQQSRTLAEKFQEEMHLDLAEYINTSGCADVLKCEETGEEKDYQQVQREIQDLRNRIRNLGNINAEAVEELEELEQKYDRLTGAYNDLINSKEEVMEFMEKLNHNSRQLFMKTFNEVAGYFYDIFRDLFGGGRAELRLEEDVDVLESGVEIVVQPPGKELRTLSLMSGGEKTMTCVAMLLALFKSHPSPFCILDEVDAALDEPNIVRLMEVITQFLDKTQFVVISHSRKTISYAHTIYGVTMQDSGISKQVSVRFEDVREDGEIESLGIKLFPDETREVG